MTPEDLAEIAYEAWRERMWWGDKGGNQAPVWSELSQNARDAWIAAASAVKGAVKDAVLGPMTRVNET